MNRGTTICHKAVRDCVFVFCFRDGSYGGRLSFALNQYHVIGGRIFGNRVRTLFKYYEHTVYPFHVGSKVCYFCQLWFPYLLHGHLPGWRALLSLPLLLVHF